MSPSSQQQSSITVVDQPHPTSCGEARPSFFKRLFLALSRLASKYRRAVTEKATEEEKADWQQNGF